MNRRRFLHGALAASAAALASRTALGQLSGPSSSSTVGTLADLRILEPVSNQITFVLGYANPGDGGGGLYAWKDHSREDDNGGTIVSSDRRRSGNWHLVGDAGVYDIRSFGALGREQVSETSAIQRAIDAAHKAGGGVVKVPPGTFLLDDPGSKGYCLNLPSRVTLRGASADLSTLRLNTAKAGGIRIVSGASDVSIERIKYDGRRNDIVPDGHAGWGIRGSNGTKRVTVADCHIENVWGRSLVGNGDGLLVHGDERQFADGFTVRNVHVRNAGSKAIQLRKTKHAVVENCIVEVNPRDGEAGASAVESSRSLDVVIKGIVARQHRPPLGPGFRVVSNSRDVWVMDSQVYGARQSCVCIDAQKVRFVRVRGEKSSLTGVLVNNSDIQNRGLTCEDILVSGCVMIDPGENGVVVNTTSNGKGPKNVRVLDNIIEGADGRMKHGLRHVGPGTAVQRANLISGATDKPISGNWS